MEDFRSGTTAWGARCQLSAKAVAIADMLSRPSLSHRDRYLITSEAPP
jgi:hypothetical protein